jgi:hypothetical protein
MLPYIATVMALVIYALQNQLTVRVRTLRSAEGEGFDADFWKAIQRLSVLHMFMAMMSVIGVIVAISMFSAPKGFSSLGSDWGNSEVFLAGALIAAGSLVLIGINLPFMLDVERIGHQKLFSAGASILSMWLYLGLLLMLFLRTIGAGSADAPLGFALGLVFGALIWMVLGGQYLLRNGHQEAPATA